MGVIEVWDAGHGGDEPGAIDGINPIEHDSIITIEKVITLAVVSAVKRLRPNIIFTRNDDRSLKLDERAAIANRHKAGLFISVHCNAASDPQAQGIETWYHAQSSRGLHLASFLYKELLSAFPEFAGRGVRSDFERYPGQGFAVLRETICPAALVELGFLTNPHDERILVNSATIERAAQALSQGVDIYLREEGME